MHNKWFSHSNLGLNQNSKALSCSPFAEQQTDWFFLISQHVILDGKVKWTHHKIIFFPTKHPLRQPEKNNWQIWHFPFHPLSTRPNRAMQVPHKKSCSAALQFGPYNLTADNCELRKCNIAWIWMCARNIDATSSCVQHKRLKDHKIPTSLSKQAIWLPSNCCRLTNENTKRNKFSGILEQYKLIWGQLMLKPIMHSLVWWLCLQEKQLFCSCRIGQRRSMDWSTRKIFVWITWEKVSMKNSVDVLRRKNRRQWSGDCRELISCSAMLVSWKLRVEFCCWSLGRHYGIVNGRLQESTHVYMEGMGDTAVWTRLKISWPYVPLCNSDIHLNPSTNALKHLKWNGVATQKYTGMIEKRAVWIHKRTLELAAGKYPTNAHNFSVPLRPNQNVQTKSYTSIPSSTSAQSNAFSSMLPSSSFTLSSDKTWTWVSLKSASLSRSLRSSGSGLLAVSGSFHEMTPAVKDRRPNTRNWRLA